jgi:hypothetical protein
MDAMQGIGQNIGKFAPLAMAPLGLIQNIMAGRQQQDFYNQVMQQEKATQAKLTPEAIAAGTSKLTAPLTLALQHAVGNGVQADLAQRGLSQSPGIYAEAMAQGLAPYAQQNQMAALRAYLESTGQGHIQLPAGFRPPPGMDMTGIIRMLMQLRQPQGQQQLGGLVQGLDNATIPSGSDTMWNTSPSDAQYPQQGSE